MGRDYKEEEKPREFGRAKTEAKRIGNWGVANRKARQ